jgi:hypothetical protein
MRQVIYPKAYFKSYEEFAAYKKCVDKLRLGSVIVLSNHGGAEALVIGRRSFKHSNGPKDLIINYHLSYTVLLGYKDNMAGWPMGDSYSLTEYPYRIDINGLGITNGWHYGSLADGKVIRIIKL